MIRVYLSLVCLLCTAGTSAGESIVAIEGATVVVTPDQILQKATVLVRGKTIAAVGTNLTLPPGAKRIDGSGKVVTAGLVESSSRLGLQEVELVRATNEGGFAAGKDSVHAAYRVTDGFNPFSISIPIARTGGVTGSVSTPVGGMVSGTSAWFSLTDPAPGTGHASVIADSIAMYAPLGEGALASADGSRGIAVERLRELFDDADQYRKRRRDYERNQTRDFMTRRLDLAALEPVLTRKIPLVLRVHRASDIRAAILLGRELGIRIVIEGGTEAWTVARDLATDRIPVIVDPSANLPSSFDRLQVRNDGPAVLRAAGVTVAISTLGSASDVRTLRQLAGIAVAYGMSKADALAAITTAPATIFRVQDRGFIKPGAIADLVIWSGDPLEISSYPEHVFIGGETQSLDNRQSELLRRYRTLK